MPTARCGSCSCTCDKSTVTNFLSDMKRGAWFFIPKMLGILTALAWSLGIEGMFADLFDNLATVALLLYAIVVTILAVLLIVCILGRVKAKKPLLFGWLQPDAIAEVVDMLKSTFMTVAALAWVDTLQALHEWMRGDEEYNKWWQLLISAVLVTLVCVILLLLLEHAKK